MKTNIKIGLLLSLIICFVIYAQDSIRLNPSLEAAELSPYKMQITYNKTTHLLFPSPIQYVDLGSDFLVASKAEPVSNVLRIKSAVKEFNEETNFSVVTEDGRFYSFDVYYSAYPETLSYDLLKLQRSTEQNYASDVLFEDLGGSSSSLTGLLMQRIYDKSEKNIRHVGSKSYGIQFSLRSLYIHESQFYFILDLKNSSQISYDIDYVNFKVVDKKNLKRTVVQDKLLHPLRIYPTIESVNHQSQSRILFLLSQFTLLSDQVLLIEIFEKDGGRHQTIELDNSVLIHARAVNQIHLKLK